MRKYLIGLLILLMAATGASWWYFRGQALDSSTKQTAAATGVTTGAPFDKHRLSLTDPASIWAIVNKQHPLRPINYAPRDLREPSIPLSSKGRPEMQLRSAAAGALEQLDIAAAATGVHLQVISGYRSYEYQVSLYDGYVHSVGQTAADQESARPGYSEHQTGLAVDLGGQDNTCTLEACFGETPEGKWLDANAYKYGYILRYPADKTAITGYEYEPWHFRYVGTSLSDEMHKHNIQTLEEFFGVTGGTAY